MSYSTVNDKYRKYTDLLRNAPSNSLYMRKLQKYKTLLSKNAQMGGNGSYSNPFAEPMSDTNVNKSLNNKTNTSELINKIHNMVAHIQQTNAMEGGGRGGRALLGKASQGKGSGYKSGKNTRSKTQVKGSRVMVGGAGSGDEEKHAEIDFSVANFTFHEPTPINFNKLLEVQKQANAIIIQGVDNLKNDKTQLEARLAALQADNSRTSTDIGKVRAELEAKTTWRRKLQN
jgi:hypothetical protein